MRRRNRSGHRMMLRGKPGVIVLGLFLFLGVFIAYYIWNSGSSVPTKNSRFGDKFVFPGRNSGPKYDSQKKPQLEDPRNVQNLQKGADPFVRGRKTRPLEPAAQFGGHQNEFRKNVDDDYDLRSKSFDDDDIRDDTFQEDSKDDPRKSFTVKSEEDKEDQRARFQKFDEEKKDSAPDPKTVEEFRKMEHLVHIDLKGAPPKMDYLIGLFPLLRKLGATGLLMEYEDMFPYSGDLQIIAANNAYSNEDISRLLTTAKNNGLKVIPLIQTFGHMEFVLKYSKFKNLRESADTPQVISPVAPGSYNVIDSMIDQVLALHPDTPFLHIGCDEVYELGKGRTVDVMKMQNLTKHHMFMSHVKKVAGQVRSKYPKTKVIMWDDELRYTSEKDIQKSGLGDLVELMVWCYVPNIKERISMDILQKYSKHFSGLWAASSFKGATGSDQFFTNISHHLQNHLSWIQLVKDLKASVPETKFRGFAMTGWQRYDHFAILCELLPSSIPSLAVNLQAIQNGGISKEIHETVRKLLNCSNPLELDAPKNITQDCRFPGSDFYYGVQELWKDLSSYYNDLGLQSRIRGWLTEYHVKTHFSSPGQMKVLGKKLSKIVDNLQSIEKPLRGSLEKIYGEETVEEWVQTHVVEIKNDLKGKLEKVTSLLKGDKVWNKRPSASRLAKQTQNLSPNVRMQKQMNQVKNRQNASNFRNDQFVQGQGQQTGLFGQKRQNTLLQKGKQGLFGQAQFNKSSGILNQHSSFQQGRQGGLQNKGQEGRVLGYQGQAGGLIQNQGQAGGLLLNQGQAGGLIQNQGQAGGLIQNQGQAGGLIQNQGQAGLLLNQGQPGGGLPKQAKLGGMLPSQGQQGGLLNDHYVFKGEPVRPGIGGVFNQKKSQNGGNNFRDFGPPERSKSPEGLGRGIEVEKLIKGPNGDQTSKNLLVNAAKDKFKDRYGMGSEGKQEKSSNEKYMNKDNKLEGLGDETDKHLRQRKEELRVNAIGANDEDDLRNNQIHDFDQDMAGHKHSKTDKHVPVNDEDGDGKKDHDIEEMRRVSFGKKMSKTEDLDKLTLQKGGVSEESKNDLIHKSKDHPEMMNNKILNSPEKNANGFKNLQNEKSTKDYDDYDDDPKRGFKSNN